jgi:hypothetical protein
MSNSRAIFQLPTPLSRREPRRSNGDRHSGSLAACWRWILLQANMPRESRGGGRSFFGFSPAGACMQDGIWDLSIHTPSVFRSSVCLSVSVVGAGLMNGWTLVLRDQTGIAKWYEPWLVQPSLPI